MADKATWPAVLALATLLLDDAARERFERVAAQLGIKDVPEYLASLSCDPGPMVLFVRHAETNSNRKLKDTAAHDVTATARAQIDAGEGHVHKSLDPGFTSLGEAQVDWEVDYIWFMSICYKAIGHDFDYAVATSPLPRAKILADRIASSLGVGPAAVWPELVEPMTADEFGADQLASYGLEPCPGTARNPDLAWYRENCIRPAVVRVRAMSLGTECDTPIERRLLIVVTHSLFMNFFDLFLAGNPLAEFDTMVHHPNICHTVYVVGPANKFFRLAGASMLHVPPELRSGTHAAFA